MKEVDLKQVIEDKSPGLIKKYPKFIANPVLWWISKVFRVKEINSFIRKTKNDFGFDFIDKLFQEVNSTYEYDKKALNRIPKEGPVIIVSNHPLGALDGVGIVRVVGERRPDVKIVVNDILAHLTNLEDLFLPIDLYSDRPQRKNLMNIANHIKKGNAIIFFPAGVVSRMDKFKVKDKEWTKGAVNFGRKFKSPIICAKIDNRNSLLFYFLTKLKDSIAPFLFPREMFNFVDRKLKVRFGKLIEPSIYESVKSDKDLTLLLRNYVYNIENAPQELEDHLKK